MRIVLVYQENSDHGREAIEWAEEFEKRSGREVEKLDPETREGEGFCRARDIVRYPAVVVCGEDGKVYEQWVGKPLPTIDDALAYMV